MTDAFDVPMSHTDESAARLSRRTLLRRSLLAGAGACFGAWLTACAASDDDSAPAPPSSPSPTTATTAAATGAGSRTLLAYFSRPGENYYYGDRIDLAVGNTQVLAELMAGMVTVDVYRIEAAEPYADSYDDTVARNVREQDADARPAIAGVLPSLDTYDTLLLGSPIWNVRPPMIMHTFLEAVDTSGKRLFPFVTYAVSGLGNTVRDYTALAPDATIGEGLAVLGETVADAGPEAEAWLRQIGVLP
jgi:flavodoxin